MKAMVVLKSKETIILNSCFLAFYTNTAFISFIPPTFSLRMFLVICELGQASKEYTNKHIPVFHVFGPGIKEKI